MKQAGIRPRASALLAAAAMIAAAVGACTSSQVDKSRGETFKQYETIVRWSQWDAAVDFIAPEYLVENPISRLDMDRLRMFQVTAYTVRSMGMLDEGLTARQLVEIRLFNKARAVEQTVIDEQEWRYNEERKRWLLHSGLPDPTARY